MTDNNIRVIESVLGRALRKNDFKLKIQEQNNNEIDIENQTAENLRNVIINSYLKIDDNNSKHQSIGRMLVKFNSVCESMNLIQKNFDVLVKSICNNNSSDKEINEMANETCSLLKDATMLMANIMKYKENFDENDCL